MPELWDIRDQNRNLTGKTMLRGDEIPPGMYHLVVHVCLFNAAGEMLIQQRQPFKHGWPNMWDISVGGSATTGDSSQDAAERECLEEIGYALELHGEPPAMSFTDGNVHDDYYILRRDIDLTKLQLQYEEVQAVKWASLAEILEMIDAGTFIPYRKCFFTLLFEMRDGRGTRSRLR